MVSRERHTKTAPGTEAAKAARPFPSSSPSRASGSPWRRGAAAARLRLPPGRAAQAGMCFTTARALRTRTSPCFLISGLGWSWSRNRSRNRPRQPERASSVSPTTGAAPHPHPRSPPPQRLSHNAPLRACPGHAPLLPSPRPSPPAARPEERTRLLAWASGSSSSSSGFLERPPRLLSRRRPVAVGLPSYLFLDCVAVQRGKKGGNGLELRSSNKQVTVFTEDHF
ncbi:uncharacterized protein [Notamacropus eugenii]|uniref:uncharacterized protein n=1 Tax=Notamacropus eugenii TaxID=9315 RepID=UPI003B68616E